VRKKKAIINNKDFQLREDADFPRLKELFNFVESFNSVN
jgi:hypothetical protein